jgi:tRNA (guanine37-N1)-methyltransferase
MAVPDVLLSGHHGKVARWRREQALRRTFERRPDLLRRAALGPAERLLMAEWQAAQEAAQQGAAQNGD